jgi:hypothetical protein
MIKLDVENYCHDCDAFNPVADSMSYQSLGVEQDRDTFVRCSNAKRCHNMVRYLERKLKSNGEQIH